MTPTPSPMDSPRRRVLADKTTNASLSVPFSPSHKHRADSPIGRFNYQKPGMQGKMPTIAAGYKRTISQVEDFEQQALQHQGPQPKERDTVGVMVDDRPTKQNDKTPVLQSSSNRLSTLPTTSSFHASQEPEPELELTFDVQDDALGDSQVEKLNATHIPHDNVRQRDSNSPEHSSSPSRQSHQSLHTIAPGGSQESLHMSSFLDFSQNDTDNKNFKTITPPSVKSLREPEIRAEDAEARKKFISEKAALLRTNLQLAYHKIQTDQTTTPFRKLRPPPKAPRRIHHALGTRNSPEPSLPPFPPLPAPRVPQIQESSTRATQTLSPESRIAVARATANAAPKPVSRPLNSIPEPKLSPTSYSARWADRPDLTQDAYRGPQPSTLATYQGPKSRNETMEKEKEGADVLQQPVQLPSSPPPSNREPSNSRARSDEDCNSGRSVTPTPCSPAKRKMASQPAQTPTPTPVQLSSPPGSCNGSPPPSHHRSKLETRVDFDASARSRTD